MSEASISATGLTAAQAAEMDNAAVQRWFEIPENQEVVLHATRGELDHLFLGLRNMAFSQGHTLTAMQHLAEGKRDLADAEFLKAVGEHIDALAYVTRFTSFIMAKATLDE